MHRRPILAALLGSLAWSLQAAAQSWPARPVKLIVPYPPGSGTDIVGRVLAQQLQAAWGQPVVVENRPGAGGTLGTDAGAKSAPDGYTLLISDVGPMAMAPHLYVRLAYDPVTDLEPISLIARLPFVLVVHPSVHAQNVADFVALAKDKPGEITYASVGNGSATHLAMEFFTAAADIRMTHVPYRGSAPALNDLVAGLVQTMFVNTASSAELIRDGKLRGLAVGSLLPSPVLPNVPTLSAGLGQEMEAGVWFGLLAPKGTDPTIVQRAAATTREALNDFALRQRLEGLGAEAASSTSAEFATLIRTERDRWGPVVRSSGARID